MRRALVPIPVMLPVTLLVVLLAALLVVLPLAPAPAAPPDPAGATALSAAAPKGYAGTVAPVRLALADDAGAPVGAAELLVERRTTDGWSEVARATTGEDGTAVVGVERARTHRGNHLRITFAGEEDLPPAITTTDLPLRLRGTRLALSGPERVRPGARAVLTVTWRTGRGTPVPGAVRLLRRTADGGWQPDRVLRTGADGVARATVRPETDTRWRALADPTPWASGARSTVHVVALAPPVPPVVLPSGAPSPRVHVPAQRAGVGAGAHPVITRIPDGVWRSMTGVSWHEGCPVGRDGLRLLRINYWGYDGYRHRGELVAALGAVGSMSRALAALYRHHLPLRSMYRVDRFGYSARVRGGNDYRSMAAGNTSAFNCRWVTNRPGVVSPHSYGRALDLNTWENPYRSARGLVPNSWWQAHSHPRVAWRSRSHRVVRLLLQAGFSWTYGLGDTQHFDVRGGAGRVRLDPRCRGIVCD